MGAQQSCDELGTVPYARLQRRGNLLQKGEGILVGGKEAQSTRVWDKPPAAVVAPTRLDPPPFGMHLY